MALNINREVEDTFYRYKMPKLNAKVEGKGNGIKTVIVNVSDIAKALNRKPIYVTKFFGCELGAQIHVDDKNDRYIVNGAHEATKLQELLDGFIKKFVLCQGCGNPETTMHVSKKSGTVATTCKACGKQGQLDVTHRLTQFIVKNPPEPDTSAKGKIKKSKKGKNGEKNSDDDHDVSAAGGDDVSRHSPVINLPENDEDWGEDTTEEAQMQRMNELSAMAKSLALSVDVDKSESEKADVLYKHLLRLHKQDLVVCHKREIKQQADSLELGARSVLVLADALLSNPSSIISDVNKYASIFMPFTRHGDNKKRAQQYLLGAMAKLVERFLDKGLLAKSCHLLKSFYDNDLIEEDVIIAWYQKGPSKKFVSRELSAKILSQCGPMVKWLQEAEEESDEVSEDDDEPEQAEEALQIKNGSPHIETRTYTSACESKNESDDDEIDIDAI